MNRKDFFKLLGVGALTTSLTKAQSNEPRTWMIDGEDGRYTTKEAIKYLKLGKEEYILHNNGRKMSLMKTGNRRIMGDFNQVEFCYEEEGEIKYLWMDED